jgi:hypothetical protein
VAWTALAWARWVGLVGPEAAALDRDAVLALGRWSRASGRQEVSGLGAWALGVVAGAAPSWGGDGAPDRALANLQHAREAGVGGLWIDADQLVWVARPTGDAEMIERLEQRLRTAVSPAPEEARAVQVGG